MRINQPIGDKADIQVLHDVNNASYLQKTGISYSILVLPFYVFIHFSSQKPKL